jgi:hypothetical protein
VERTDTEVHDADRGSVEVNFGIST